MRFASLFVRTFTGAGVHDVRQQFEFMVQIPVIPVGAVNGGFIQQQTVHMFERAFLGLLHFRHRDEIARHLPIRFSVRVIGFACDIRLLAVRLEHKASEFLQLLQTVKIASRHIRYLAFVACDFHEPATVLQPVAYELRTQAERLADATGTEYGGHVRIIRQRPIPVIISRLVHA